MKRIAAVMAVAGWLVMAVAGCGWMGRTAAKTKNAINTGAEKIGASIERMDKDFKDAYHKEKVNQ